MNVAVKYRIYMLNISLTKRIYYAKVLLGDLLIEREDKESSTEDLVIERDQVKLKKSSLRRQLLETGVVFFLGGGMKKIKRFVFLSEEFYQNYPSKDYPEIEQKRLRPYIQVYVEVDGIKFAIPLRSDIHHPHVLWTDKENHCGVDFSKAVVIEDERYIDMEKEPHLRQNEFDALRGKDFKLKQKMKKYIEDYKKAKADPDREMNQTLLKYSTLQYFDKYI